MSAAATAGKLARAPADPGKAPGVAAPGAPAAAPPAKEIPEVLVDPRSRRRYLRGRFLGKGGFAKCFEISDADTKEVFAGKIVPKSLLLKPHQKEKMSMEISIHRSLAHQHVVGFHGFFEDNDFVFVVLELCRRRVSVAAGELELSWGRGWGSGNRSCRGRSARGLRAAGEELLGTWNWKWRKSWGERFLALGASREGGFWTLAVGWIGGGAGEPCLWTPGLPELLGKGY